MPLQMVMKIEGVSGESKSYRHRGWSEVLSWTWGMTSNRKSTVREDTDKTMLNEIAIVKPVGVDSSSIRLLYAQGTRIPNIELSITPVVGKKEIQMKYVNIVMQDVLIKSIVTGGNIDDSFFKEHITLLFDKVAFECSRDAEGSGNDVEAGGAEDFLWDVAAGAEWKK